MTTTRTKAHRDAMRKDLHQLVAELIDAVGPTTVQAMAGVKDRSMPSRWARPDGPRPQQETENRLRLGYAVWLMMSESEGPRVAAPWMHGANPQLGEDTPITAIRELRSAEVVGAAEAFIGGNYAA